MGDLIRAVVDLVRRRENARATFIAPLNNAQDEGRRDRAFKTDEVAAELDEIIAEAERSLVSLPALLVPQARRQRASALAWIAKYYAAVAA
jgi:hypothetical protein